MGIFATKIRTSAVIGRELTAAIEQSDMLTGRIVDAERKLAANALDADVATITAAQSELAALKLKRTALNTKADQLAAERHATAVREEEAAKVEHEKAERKAHHDAIKRLPAAVAKVEAAHAALNEALAELGRLDGYAGAMAAFRARPTYGLPDGFACYATKWEEVAPEAVRVRHAIMEGTHLSYSVRDSDCGRNVAASKIWGYV